MDTDFVIIDERDNVATALAPLPKGAVVARGSGDERGSVVLGDDIPVAHKFALVSIGPGEDVIKYGEVIGRATCLIRPGAHVHIHNVEGLRGRGDKA